MWQIGLPMIVSMVLQALYNVVDSVFVTNMKDTGVLANEALTYVLPIQILIIAIGVGTGIGLIALLSKNLGEKSQEEVNKIAGNGIFLRIVIYLIFLSLGSTNQELTKVWENAIHIVSFSYIFMGFNVAIQGVFQALRYALRPLFTFIFAFIFVKKDNVTTTVWWTFLISEVLTSIVSYFYLRNTIKTKMSSLE